MDRFHLRIEGRPRPHHTRIVRKGPSSYQIVSGHVQRWMREIREAAKKVAPDKLLSGALEVRIRLSVKGRRGDLDNYAKPILDALEGIVFANDSQVTRLLVELSSQEEGEFAEVVVQSATEEIWGASSLRG